MSLGLVLYPDQLLLQLQLPAEVGPHLLDQELELGQLGLVHLDPLAAVGDRGVLQQRPEHHAEAEGQVDVKGFHVGNFWQRTAREPRF